MMSAPHTDSPHPSAIYPPLDDPTRGTPSPRGRRRGAATPPPKRASEHAGRPSLGQRSLPPRRTGLCLRAAAERCEYKRVYLGLHDARVATDSLLVSQKIAQPKPSVPILLRRRLIGWLHEILIEGRRQNSDETEVGGVGVKRAGESR